MSAADAWAPPAGAPVLRTERLELVAAAPRWALETAEYFARNAAHLGPWEPRRSGLDDPERQVEMLAQSAAAAAEGSGYRWLLRLGDLGVVGAVGVSGIVRGCHHSAHLGYSLDADCQGQGLMHEALQAVREAVFGPAIRLHRLQAAYQPHNRRSARVLERLGFREIGLARQYLHIDGAWADHLLTECLNPRWQADWSG